MDGKTLRGSRTGDGVTHLLAATHHDTLLKSGEYPIFSKIVMEAHRFHLSRDDQFRHGLQRVLDCIAAALPSTAESAMAAHREGPGEQNGSGQAAENT